MKNASKSIRSLKSMMRSAPFKRGWDDVRTGRWTNEWELPPMHLEVSPGHMYEKGRCFALWIKENVNPELPAATKVLTGVPESIQRAYIQARKEGWTV